MDVISTAEVEVFGRDAFAGPDLAAAAFLARYSGVTRRNYASDLRVWFRWCALHGVEVLDARRVQIEIWARDMEEGQQLARSTVSKRISTVTGFYRFAHIDGIISDDPTKHVRRPKVEPESTTLGLDRSELGSFIYAAEALGVNEHALACLLGLLGLRISEALGITVTDLSALRGHRIVKIMGKGRKPAIVPLPPRVARAVDQAIGERTEGHLLRSSTGAPMERSCAGRMVRRICRRAGITKRITPHSLRHSFITAALDAGVPLRDVQIAARHADPRTTTRYDRARENLDRHASYIVTAFVAGAA